ncbi:MAG: hypothetical protein QOI98_883 [Solirubrobacteraceae bacterium]|nr:hypothetical protein [Solirubrobacteraceae bacterium]
MPFVRRPKTLVLLAVSLGVALVGGSAHAIVPPKNCGTIKVSHKRWQIKADQIRCTTARKYATAYIAHHTRPRGYSCHKFKGSALYAKCVNTKANPDRTIFIIKK